MKKLKAALILSLTMSFTTAFADNLAPEQSLKDTMKQIGIIFKQLGNDVNDPSKIHNLWPPLKK